MPSKPAVSFAAIGAALFTSFVPPAIWTAITVYWLGQYGEKFGRDGTFQIGMVFLAAIAVMQGLGCALSLPLFLRCVTNAKSAAILAAATAIIGLLSWQIGITQQLANGFSFGTNSIRIYEPMVVTVIVFIVVFSALGLLYSLKNPRLETRRDATP